jgi:hypothetical protein
MFRTRNTSGVVDPEMAPGVETADMALSSFEQDGIGWSVAEMPRVSAHTQERASFDPENHG